MAEHFAERAVITGPLTIPPAPDSPAAPASDSPTLLWSNVSRLTRRLCLLRERGDDAAAEQLRNGPLADAIRAVRTKVALPNDEFDRQLESILAAEQERVANATVLAELLAPMLKEYLGTPHAGEFASHASPPLPLAHAAEPAATARPKPANIADFIDEMLAQEKAPPNRAPVRRAS